MKHRAEGFKPAVFVLLAAATLLIFLLCVSFGSVSVPFRDAAAAVWRTLRGLSAADSLAASIMPIRLPRALCAGLLGAILSLCGCAMQGLLKNPLADGSTLGVSAGASLGAVLAITFGIAIPGLPFAGTTVMAALFAFLSLVVILSLAYKLDGSLSTNTIVLVGVIYSMFVSSVISILITFSGDKARHILFWTMGSLTGVRYQDALLLLGTLVLFGGALLCHARELNAFAIGEDNARNVGVPVRRVKFIVLVCVSAMVGVSVSVGGTIAFVGLVAPHMVRMVVGPNHRRLMPAAAFCGASFLMLCDLVSRTLLRPLELPIGVVTSFVGAILFVYIFYTSRRQK